MSYPRETRQVVWEWLNYEHAIFGTNNMVFRAYRYAPDHIGIKGRNLDPERYADLNALNPKRFTVSEAGSTVQGLGVTFKKGSFVKGGH